MTYEFQKWPCWFYGPNGASQIFNEGDTIPAGWHDHPSKVKGAKSEPAPVPQPAPTEPVAQDAELDAHGWPWTPELHAASKGKTSAGLWRMKVGATRPAPKEGYPIPAVPLEPAAPPAPLDL